MPNRVSSSSAGGANGMTSRRRYDLTADPVFYVTLGIFCFLTTFLPAFLGQPNLLPVLQTVALTVFLAIPLRRGRIYRGVLVVSIWLLLQFLIMSIGTTLLPRPFDRAIHDGFSYYDTLLLWLHSGGGLQEPVLASPLARLGEFILVLLGSLLTAGLVGVWLLTRAVNELGFVVGLMASGGPATLLVGLMPWRVMTIAGHAGLVVLLAQPLLTNNWSPAFYIGRYRRFTGLSIILVALGLVLEYTIPGLWKGVWGY
ncbi:MAG: hypothetical protein OXL39_03210 [Caldilineaceae bacterium]|nr:hypothetical protein [Caldilineaceae bacterium]